MNACTPPARPARIVWLDLLKVAAIFMMLAVHCTDNVTPAERSEPWYNLWGSLYGSLLRPAIPLFVMVTGALLLPVRENMQTFYRKRIPRVAVPFLLWSVLYNLFPWFTGLLGLDAAVINEFFVWAEPSQAAADALHHVAMIPFTFSLFAVQMWYVYLLIGLYLYLPVFSAWVSQSTAGEQRFFLSIWVVSLFIPYLREFVSADLWGACSWNEFNMLYYFAGFNGYLLLGYYLRHHLTPIRTETRAGRRHTALRHRLCSHLFRIQDRDRHPWTNGRNGRTFLHLLHPQRAAHVAARLCCGATTARAVRHCPACRHQPVRLYAGHLDVPLPVLGPLLSADSTITDAHTGKNGDMLIPVADGLLDFCQPHTPHRNLRPVDYGLNEMKRRFPKRHPGFAPNMNNRPTAGPIIH